MRPIVSIWSLDRMQDVAFVIGVGVGVDVDVFITITGLLTLR